MMLTFTGIQAVLTVAFAWYLSAAEQPSLWVMGLLLFTASLFFNALQPVGHALTAELAPGTPARLGVRNGEPHR